jgi:hypothetical protein
VDPNSGLTNKVLLTDLSEYRKSRMRKAPAPPSPTPRQGRVFNLAGGDPPRQRVRVGGGGGVRRGGDGAVGVGVGVAVGGFGAA